MSRHDSDVVDASPPDGPAATASADATATTGGENLGGDHSS